MEDRNIEDTVVDERGKMMLAMLDSMNMVVMNGLERGDGRSTMKGKKSVIDWCIISENSRHKVKKMEVISKDSILDLIDSDHHMISIHIDNENEEDNSKQQLDKIVVGKGAI